MTREEFEKMVCSLDGEALEVLDGEVDGFDPNSPLNPCPEEMGLDEDASEEEIEESLMSNYFYNFDVEVAGSVGPINVSGTFAVQDGYVDRIERLEASRSDGSKLSDDDSEMAVVYDRMAELLRNKELCAVKLPKDYGDEAVTFNGMTYHLVGKPDFQELDRGVFKCFNYAIADDAVVDDDGKYPCVSVEFTVVDGKRDEPVGVEETETVYDTVKRKLEEEDLF